MRAPRSLTVLLLSTIGLLAVAAGAAPKPQSPPVDEEATEFQTRTGVAPREMMSRYLLARVEAARQQWEADYEARTTPEQITAHRERLKAMFVERIGGLPERTPLEPRIVDRLARDGYRVEKIVFESQPRHHVTAALFLPSVERYAPPYPGILVPCGHSANGKALAVYQRACALAARNGMAALIFDPIDQGERHQCLDAQGRPRTAGTQGHNMIGVGSILLGRNTARFEIWDGMRGIDYLQSRDDIDPGRIGCMGNSGGGTQTAYLMALDDRIVAASPSCYICGLYGRLVGTGGAQDAEQNIHGQLAWGMDHADYCLMRAPRPTLLCTATRDFFDIDDAWSTFRRAKRLYTRLGFGERLSLVEAPGAHGYSLLLREAAVRWMARWLLGRDEAITEPPGLEVLTEEEIRCTEGGEVMLLEGARSVYDLNRDHEAELAGQRHRRWNTAPREENLESVRRIAGIRALEDLLDPELVVLGSEERDGYRVERLCFEPEPGIWLPALLFVPDGAPAGNPVLYVHEEGKGADAGPRGPIEELLRAGHVVLAVDLRGNGLTQQVGQRYFTPSLFGGDGQDVYVAYLLGRSYVGMRAEDLLVCARWLGREGAPVRLTAVGELAIPALHAAAVEPELFAAVRLVQPLVSWSNVVELGFSHHRLSNTVHGALTAYDLPDLARSLGDKVVLEGPRDALGEPVTDGR